ncbi:MAG: hypothetical protein IK139_02670 [Lachnospiraceae bacterium]|nr:hypothetical protein [Lachnospiraceae bacterium]
MSLPNDRYPKIAQVLSREDIMDLYRDLSTPMPPDLDSIPEENMVVLKVSDGESTCGMAAGFIPPGSDFCRIQTLFLEGGYRNAQNTAALIKCIYEKSGKHPGVKKTVWRYQAPPADTPDAHMKICAMAGDIPFTSKIVDHVFIMDLHEVMNIRPKIRTCDEAFLVSKGFKAVRCIDCIKERKEEIGALLKDADSELLQLSPIDEKERDEDNSFFVISREDDSICGWMICRKMEEGCVEIARLYVFQGHRKTMTGLYFGAFMLKRLGERYDRAQMKVFPGNMQVINLLRKDLGKCTRESFEKLITMEYQKKP